MLNRTLKHPSHTTEKGQIIILLALGFIVLLFFLGLAIDATMLYVTQEKLRSSVDAAALAAANKLPDQTKAIASAYTYMRLHNYDYDPVTKPLTIYFPTYDPPRKVVSVRADSTYKYSILRMIGWTTTPIYAIGEGESAPLDLYLVLDLSTSMVYDTLQPANWTTVRQSISGCSTAAWSTSNSACMAKYCNIAHTCDPLDGHIKPAAYSFIDKLSSSFDRIGLVTYDQTGEFHVALTNDFNSVKTAIADLEAWSGGGMSTNTGDGIMISHDHLAAEGRMDAIWSIVLMSDGRANTYRTGTGCSACPPNCGSCTTITQCSYCQASIDWAIAQARDTYSRHEAVIYTIGFGAEVATYSTASGLLKNIADYTDNGRLDGNTNNYWQVPDEAGLRVAFGEIAERIFSRLIK